MRAPYEREGAVKLEDGRFFRYFEDQDESGYWMELTPLQALTAALQFDLQMLDEQGVVVTTDLMRSYVSSRSAWVATTSDH